MTKTESANRTVQAVVIEACEQLLECHMAAGARLAIPNTNNLIMVGPQEWIAKNVPGVEAMVEASEQPGDDQWIFDLAVDHESRGNGLYGPITFSSTALVDFVRAVITRLAATTQASTAQAEPSVWISVDERLPEGTCIASYQPHRRGHKPCIIRAVYFKQYQIEASGDDGESTDYNEANDTDYIKAGWYERIDNWGDFASVSVCEGVVTHWMPLPAAPGALCAPLAATSSTDAQAAPTDISKRLRDCISQNVVPFPADVLAAAEEIERYYGGMMAWKRTAEKKDRDWNEVRMARENDRCAARADAQAAAEVREEAARLAPILRGMCEGGGPEEGINIYADDYQAADGDVFVQRAADLLEEFAALRAGDTGEQADGGAA